MTPTDAPDDLPTLLPIYVVYDRPLDFPDYIVVRAHVAMRDGTTRVDRNAHLFDTIDAARAYLAATGLACLTRAPEDDPKIVETWL